MRKKNIWQNGRGLLGLAALSLLTAANGVLAADDSPSPKFLGSQSCSSSSCHGGASEKTDQVTIWFKSDFHHVRPTARLETRRAAVITENLRMGNPMQATACTVCHAPLQTVPPAQLGPDAHVIEGVSCENCHAPAEHWLISHTRKDWSTADRVQAGLRDLKNLYVRANTCVACHQNVSKTLRDAGHPALIFEMDGQCATEPRHWSKAKDKPGPQIWLVGQAVALREMSWQLSLETEGDEILRQQWDGLEWLMESISKIDASWPQLSSADRGNFQQVQQWSDELAKAVAGITWSGDLTRKCLTAVADSSNTFANQQPPNAIQARRAERLVLAMDRLLKGATKLSNNQELSRTLDGLFADVQSLPDFKSDEFAKHLEEFHSRLANAAN